MRWQWLIVVLEAIFLCALIIIVASYYFVYKKLQTTKKYENKYYFLALGIGFVMSLLTVCTNLGLNIHYHNVNNHPTVKIIWIISIVISYIFLILMTACLYFRLHYIVIAVDKEYIHFLGEKVAYRKIIDLKKDDKKNKFVISYKEGKVFANKKYTFCLKSKAYHFLTSHLDFIKEQIIIKKDEYKQLELKRIAKEQELKQAYLDRKNLQELKQAKKEEAFNLEQKKEQLKNKKTDNESK